MSQIVQVQSGQTAVRLPDLVTHEALEKVLLSDGQFDTLSTDAFTSVLTDLGPGILSAVVSLSGVTDNGQVVATWTPGFRGVIRSVMAIVSTAVTTASKSANFAIKIDQDTGTSEVNVVTITGSPTGGTFTLTAQGGTTGTIAYNASAATVQTALEALTAVKVGDVTVTGSAGGPYTLTWGGNLAETDITLTASGAGLTGGSTPGVTISTSTGGVAGSVTPVSMNGGALALTSANCTPIGKTLVGTNVKFTAANPNVFAADAAIQLVTSGAPTAFSEGTVVFLLAIEPVAVAQSV